MEEFVTRFPALANGDTVFVATVNMRELGVESEFVVALADKTPVLVGRGVVVEAWADSNNQFKRPGLRVRVHDVKPTSTLSDQGSVLASSKPSLVTVTTRSATPGVHGTIPARRSVATLPIPRLAARGTSSPPVASGTGRATVAVPLVLDTTSTDRSPDIQSDVEEISPDMIETSSETTGPSAIIAEPIPQMPNSTNIPPTNLQMNPTNNSLVPVDCKPFILDAPTADSISGPELDLRVGRGQLRFLLVLTVVVIACGFLISVVAT